MSEPLSKRLERMRKERGLTQRELAQQIGISVSTYRDWEAGRAILGEPYMKLASALGVGLVELMTGQKSCPLSVLNKVILIKKTIKQIEIELASFFERDSSV